MTPRTIKKGETFDFCALAYNPCLEAEGSPADRAILMLLVQQSDEVFILIDPNWRRFVHAVDVAYIESIVEDFKHRAETDASCLFKQASELNLGPLLTQETGSARLGDERIAEIMGRFLPV